MPDSWNTVACRTGGMGHYQRNLRICKCFLHKWRNTLCCALQFLATTTEERSKMAIGGGASGGTVKSDSKLLDRLTFGHRIRAARKQLGWTLSVLSEASGVSITTISRAERGLLALGYENFSALA